MCKKVLAIFLSAFAGVLFLAQPLDASIIVLGGTATFTSSANPAVRYKGFDNGSNRRSYVGQDSLGSAANRSEQTASYSASNSFTFTFDGIQTVTSKLNSNATISKVNSADPGSLNALQFRVRNQGAGTVTLSNLVVAGNSIGGTWTATAAQNYFTLVGIDLSSAWSITGDIGLSGAMAGNESSLVEFVAGFNTSYDQYLVPEPSTLGIWTLGAVCFGLFGSRRRAIR